MALPIDAAKNVTIVTNETLNGSRCWRTRIELKKPDGYQLDFWIDEEFRVHRAFQNGVDIRSYYELKEYPYLPSRVETQEYDAKGTPVMGRTFQILSAKANVVFRDSDWSLDALHVPINSPVLDTRIHKRIGYWNGKGIGAEIDSPKQIKPPFTVAIIAVIVIPIWFLIKYRKSPLNT